MGESVYRESLVRLLAIHVLHRSRRRVIVTDRMVSYRHGENRMDIPIWRIDDVDFRRSLGHAGTLLITDHDGLTTTIKNLAHAEQAREDIRQRLRTLLAPPA